MGFDLYATNKDHNGERLYFRASVWSWRPIVDVIAETGALSPATLRHISYNDGYAITEGQAIHIAECIEHYLAADRVQRALSTTGPRIHTEPDGPGGGFTFCDNPDCTKEHMSPHFIHKEHLQEFVRFCRASGGFEVW